MSSTTPTTPTTPSSPIIAWQATTALTRFHACRVMLGLHGFLSDAESERVNARIEKWRQKHEKAERKRS